MAPQASIKEDLRRGRTELQELREEASAIVIEARAVLQQEIALARTEIGEATGHATRGLALGGVAAVVGLAGFFFGCLAAMFGLWEVMPLWAAALIVTGALVLIAGIATVMTMGHLRRRTRSRVAPSAASGRTGNGQKSS
jgi:hypothetical protein